MAIERCKPTTQLSVSYKCIRMSIPIMIGFGCHILIGATVRNTAKIELLTKMESFSLME